MKYRFLFLAFVFSGLFVAGSVKAAVIQPDDPQFLHLVHLLKKHPPNELNIRMKIIEMAKEMKRKPEMPEGVKEALGKAKFIMNKGDDDKNFVEATGAYAEATQLAPWMGDLYFNQGLIQEKAQMYQEALISYHLYLLAVPDAPEKDALQEKMGGLEYAAHITFKELTQPGQGKMVLIPAGKFMMGSPDNVGGYDEHPQHEVYLDAYYIDKYLVTYDDWNKAADAGAGFNHIVPPGGEGSKQPLVRVSWSDALAYAKFMGKRLPTEAEWEKACRGGTRTKYFWGDNRSQEKEYQWTDFTMAGGGFLLCSILHPVGQKNPNQYGLYDMGENVVQWCSDWYDNQYYKVSPDENPQGPLNGTERVLRGAVGEEGDGGSASRYWRKKPDDRQGFIGFRCAMDVPDNAGNSSKNGEASAPRAAKEKAPFKLTDSDMVFGTQQLEKMIHDRPVMAKYVKKEDPVWNWAVRQFAGEYIKGGMEWDGSDLEIKAWNQVTVPGAESGKRAFLKLARNCPVGDPHTGAVVTAPVLWHEAVAIFCSFMDRYEKTEIDKAVYAGKIGRADYVFEFLALSSIYEKNKRSDFWSKVWKPNCQKLGLPDDDGGFGVAINPRIDQAPTRAEFLKAFSAKKIENYDVYVGFYEKNVRPYLKAQDIQVPPLEGSSKIRNAYLHQLTQKPID